MNIFGLGLPELIVIALVLLLFFGKDRLPGLFRSIGSSIKELKDSVGGSTDKQTSDQDNDESVAPQDNEEEKRS